MADAETDAAIAAAWPEEWARANDPSRPRASKRRHRLRRAWAEKQEHKALREQGASCRTCVNFSLTHALGNPTTICELYSDFHGYQLADARELCNAWKPAIPPLSGGE